MNSAGFALGTILLVTAVAFAPSEAATGQSGHQGLDSAFEHYDAIRAQLAADEVANIPRHAAALRAHAERLGGAAAAEALEGLEAAGDLKAAREHFGALSAVAVPAFQAAKLKDVRVFTCAMVKQSWAQRVSDVQNPYMGKAMLSCGVPARAAR